MEKLILPKIFLDENYKMLYKDKDKDKMVNDTVAVQPKAGPVVEYVRLNIYQLVLNSGFRVACYLLNHDGVVIETQDLTIEGDEYNSWMNDDEMLDLILSKLGLEKKVENIPGPTIEVETIPGPTIEETS